MLKTLTKLETDNPQYKKGFGEPMPFASHTEYVAAKKIAMDMVARYVFGDMSEADAAELLYLEKRLYNHEKQSK